MSDVNEPFLWAAIDNGGSLIGWGHSRVSACCGMDAAECIPLYREPTLTDEVERLRLTNQERDAIEWASKTLCVGWLDLAADDKQRTRDAAATLQGLLERLGGSQCVTK